MSGAAQDPRAEPEPPPNAESLHRVRVQIAYPDEEAPWAVQLPLEGWVITAVLVQREQQGGYSYDGLTEAVTKANAAGATVLWLQQPGPYRLATDSHDIPRTGCWWSGGETWDDGSPEVILELSVVCT